MLTAALKGSILQHLVIIVYGVREMEGETTVFIVSQRAASIQHADRIVVLDDGKIVGLGTSEELLESCEVYQEIYNSQFKKQEGGKTA